jgi:hypothetical protein
MLSHVSLYLNFWSSLHTLIISLCISSLMCSSVMSLENGSLRSLIPNIAKRRRGEREIICPFGTMGTSSSQNLPHYSTTTSSQPPGSVDRYPITISTYPTFPPLNLSRVNGSKRRTKKRTSLPHHQSASCNPKSIPSHSHASPSSGTAQPDSS